MQHLSEDVVAHVRVSEAGVHLAADQVGEDIGVQADAGGELTLLTRVQVQVDGEVAVAATAQVAVALVGALCGAGYLHVDVV